MFFAFGDRKYILLEGRIVVVVLERLHHPSSITVVISEGYDVGTVSLISDDCTGHDISKNEASHLLSFQEAK